MPEQARDLVIRVRERARGLIEDLDRLLETVEAGPTVDPELTPVQPGPQRTAESEDKYYSISEAALEFGMSHKWFHTHWREIPGAGKLGAKLIRLPRAGVKRFMERCRDRR